MTVAAEEADVQEERRNNYLKKELRLISNVTTEKDKIQKAAEDAQPW